MNRKRVQMLRDMMEGVPEEKVDLNVMYVKGNWTPCGSVACMGGWAQMYPPFLKMGIAKTIKNGSQTRTLENFFGTEYGLFFVRQSGETGTHKEIALRRLDALLK